MREDIKGVSGNGIRKVRDNGNAVLSIRSFIGRCVNEWMSVRKSRGRIRM
jgi:hypothetical protein